MSAIIAKAKSFLPGEHKITSDATIGDIVLFEVRDGNNTPIDLEEPLRVDLHAGTTVVIDKDGNVFMDRWYPKPSDMNEGGFGFQWNKSADPIVYPIDYLTDSLRFNSDGSFTLRVSDESAAKARAKAKTRSRKLDRIRYCKAVRA